MAGRIFAITGASGVLGSAVARAAAAKGARIALIDHAPHAQALADCGPEAIMLGGVDLTDAVAAGAAIEAVVDRFGGLDALLNIAGGFRWETVADSTADSWYAMYRINVATAANACRAAIPHLKRSAARVNESL